ncbi:MAG: glycoside hydrolase family 3 C-terminal domain-containing protein [Bacteroidota bacterium]|nr:glycoside hydrolase family 3 C-terminal domain-containing protein [Bacteroidota bacterium]
MKSVFLLSLFMLNSFLPFTLAQEKPPYKDPKLSIENRVEDLLKRMTLDEKLDYIGGNGDATKVNNRLGIPELRMTDGPAGVRRKNQKSIAFPSPIAMASTWDLNLIEQIGHGIARATKGHARHVILGPCVNIVRTPMWGRAFESFGEDPFLSSRMGVSYIKGVQNEGVAATVKHFAVNNEEFDRDYVDAIVSHRALHEIYFPAFKSAVQEAGALCLMSSYNRVNGKYASENDYLLKDILRNQWNYKGLIMSDWGAVHSSIPTALCQLDIEMPTGEFMNQKSLKAAVETGRVPVESINEKVRNILQLIFKLGLFDKPILEEDSSLVNSQENRKIAYEASLSSIVLLKNQDNILPLNKNLIKSIAVIGPNANVARTGGGGSSEVDDISPVSFLEGLKNKLPGSVNLYFSKGIEFDDNQNITPFSSKYFFADKEGKKNGLNAEFFNNINLSGTPVLKKLCDNINYYWDENGPGSGVAKENYSVRWSGYVKVDKTDDYSIATLSDDGMRLFIDDKLIQDLWFPHGAMKRSTNIRLEKDKYYKICFELFERTGGAVAVFGENPPNLEIINKAVEIAKKTDYVILSLGTNSVIETEARDRFDLLLPKDQELLIQMVSQVNKNVIVLLTTGAPVLMDKWIGKVNAVVETWFPGTEGGNAVADILLGNANPSGKLVVTFPHKWEDCSAYNTYNRIKERTYYSDDIYVGYRHFDKYSIDPLFPFGYGLSYTTFQYSNMNVVNKDDGWYVSFELKNTGKIKGEEVAQIYTSATDPNIDRAVKELKGFSKVMLDPGESKIVNIRLDKNAFVYYSERFESWKTDPGMYKILVGSSSKDIKLDAKIKVE